MVLSQGSQMKFLLQRDRMNVKVYDYYAYDLVTSIRSVKVEFPQSLNIGNSSFYGLFL
jgi:hypothetical protein